MFQVYLPYTLSVDGPLNCEAAFITSSDNKPIAFTSVLKVSEFIKQANKLLGIKLEWGAVNNVEFPGLETMELEIDPVLDTRTPAVW